MFLDVYDFEEFTQRDRYVIPVNGQLVDVSREIYCNYYKMDRLERYQDEKQYALILDDSKMEDMFTRLVDRLSVEYNNSAEDAYFKILHALDREIDMESLKEEYKKLSAYDKEILEMHYAQKISFRRMQDLLGKDRRTIAKKHDEILRYLKKEIVK